MTALYQQSHGDLRRFLDESTVVTANGVGWIQLSDALGQMIFDSRIAFGAMPQPYDDPQSLEQSATTGHVVITNLFHGAKDHVPQFSIHYPVVGAGGVAHVLTLSRPAARLSALLAAQNMPNDWIVGIVDRDGVIMARHYRAEDFVGWHIPDGAPVPGPGQKEAFFPVVVAGGVPMYLATVRSALAGWEVAVGIPQAVVDVPLRPSVAAADGSGSSSTSATIPTSPRSVSC